MIPAPNRHRKVLVTGLPGCGKSTLIEKALAALGRPATGFFTRELRRAGRRVGFAIVTLDGRRGVLAHVELTGAPRVGRYGVNLAHLERIAVPSMAPPDEDTVVVVDEIGKMECLSAAFRRRVAEVLGGPNPVLGAVALKGGPFIAGIRRRPGVTLVTVTAENRQALAAELPSLLSAPDAGR